MTMHSRREDARYTTYLPVRLIAEGRPHFSITEDVSYGGLRIRTDAHPPLRSLVRLEVHLLSGSRLIVPAVVVHASLDQARAQPSVGLQLYGISDEDQAAWRKFVDIVRETSRVRLAGDCAGAVAAIWPRTPIELGTVQRAARAGRELFVPTSLQIEVYDRLHLLIVHHENRRLFALNTVVGEVVRDPKRPGLITRVQAFGMRDRAAFSRFIGLARVDVASEGAPLLSFASMV